MPNPRKPSTREQMREQTRKQEEQRQRTDPTHERSTNNTQTTHEHSTYATQTTHEAMKRYDVRFTADEWRELGRIAKQEGTSRGAIVRRLVREHLRGQ